jgi:hypothetical protein
VRVSAKKYKERGVKLDLYFVDAAQRRWYRRVDGALQEYPPGHPVKPGAREGLTPS